MWLYIGTFIENFCTGEDITTFSVRLYDLNTLYQSVL